MESDVRLIPKIDDAAAGATTIAAARASAIP
jgi:hypothetical protein